MIFYNVYSTCPNLHILSVMDVVWQHLYIALHTELLSIIIKVFSSLNLPFLLNEIDRLCRYYVVTLLPGDGALSALDCQPLIILLTSECNTKG